MEFSSQQDIEAPVAHVFAEITDFARFERAAERRGAELRRLDDLPDICIGMGWQAQLPVRGRMLDLTIRLDEHAPPDCIAFSAEAPSIEARTHVDLVALGPERTRLSVSMTVAPRSITGRLLLQSAKLANTNLDKRFCQRVADYARDLEERYQRAV